MFQSSNLIGWIRVYWGWVRVNLDLLLGQLCTYSCVYVTNGIEALKNTLGGARGRNSPLS